MKKFFSVIFVFMLVSYLSTVALAQTRGISHAQGHAPEVSRDHGRDQDKNADHDKNHAGTTAQDANKETKLEARIERNPGLKSKIESLLPPNTDLKTALSGFKNDGQFIAALHVSKNLGIPFDQLKATMLGTSPQLTATTAGSTTTGSTTTGSKPMSLGQAIHTLQPSLSEKDAQKEADTAENQAKVDIKITTAPKPVS